MNKIIIILSFVIFGIVRVGAQDVSCDDLMRYVEKNGRYKGTVSSIQLIDSSWLKEVKAYSIDNTIVVISEIKRDDYRI